MNNSATMFRARTYHNALRDLHIPSDGKAQVRRKVSQRAFCGFRTGTTQA
jgi:hypothetical protein